GGEDSPNDIQRGMFAGEVGVPRLRTLLERRGLPATWFVPGHSIETFPQQIEDVVNSGFEIGCHGYSHENPVAMSPQQEADVLGRRIELVNQITGEDPRGYVWRWWVGRETTAQLWVDSGLRHGYSAD